MSKLGSVFKKSNGKSKLMFSLVAVIAVAAIGFGASGGSGALQEVGNSGVDSDAMAITNTDPLGENVTKEYKDLAIKSNEIRILEAEKAGGSAIPTLLTLDNIVVKKEVDHGEVNAQVRVDAPTEIDYGSVEVAPPAPLVDARYQEIYEEQLKLVEVAFDNLGTTLVGSNHSVQVFSSGVSVASNEVSDAMSRQGTSLNLNKDQLSAFSSDAKVGGKDTKTKAASTRPKIPLGTIIPAVILTSVNSDEKGPVRAKVIGGVLDGAVLMGEFTVNEESILLQFNAMTKDGYVATISAFAVDPETSRTSLASDVNHHYFYRYGMLLSSSFLSGFSTAVSSTGSTVTQTTIGQVQSSAPIISVNKQLWAGAASIGETLSSAAKDSFNTPSTIVVNSGTLVGLLFSDSADEDWLPELKAEGY